jgi:ABC-type branched-subunit amino acid transport system substrate-binding protein
MKFRRAIALLVLLVLLVTACGSDRDDAAGTDDRSTDTTEVASGPDTSFGDLESPCGDGDAAAASDSGVTADAIAIGYGDDAGFTGAPGLNHEIGDAMKAIIQWCNDQGGINGREIKGTYYDAKITEVNNAMIKACTDQVFMLVGQGWALDAGQEETRLGCGLPSVPTYSVSPQFAHAQLMYAALPNPTDFQAVSHARWFAENHPGEAKKVGIMAANFAATLDTAAKSKSSWPKVGVEFLPCELQYNIQGEADWKPLVQKLKDCGAEAVEWVGSPEPNFEQVLEAAEQLDYHPWWLLEANFYADGFAKWNTGDLAKQIVVRSQDVPFEAAAENDAVQAYLDLLDDYGGDRSSLGLHAVSSFLLWGTAVKACGDEVTRDCVLQQLADTHEWDGGGMSGPTDPGNNMPSECEALLTLEGTRWVQLEPEQPGELHCDDKNVQAVEGQVVDQLHLGPDRRIPKA